MYSNMVGKYSFNEAKKDKQVSECISLIDELFKILKQRALIRKFNSETGDLAKRLVINDLTFFKYGAIMMTPLKPYMKKNIIQFEEEEQHLALLLCNNYNLWVEKISNLFQLILNMKLVRQKLKKGEKTFISAQDIIDYIISIYPESKKVLIFFDRKIRNALAHYNYFLHTNCIFLMDENDSDLNNPKTKVLKYHELRNATVLLNKFANILIRKIEKELKNYEINQNNVEKINKEIMESLKKP